MALIPCKSSDELFYVDIFRRLESSFYFSPPIETPALDISDDVDALDEGLVEFPEKRPVSEETLPLILVLSNGTRSSVDIFAFFSASSMLMNPIRFRKGIFTRKFGHFLINKTRILFNFLFTQLVQGVKVP